MRLLSENDPIDLFKRDNFQENLDYFYERHLDIFSVGEIGSWR